MHKFHLKLITNHKAILKLINQQLQLLSKENNKNSNFLIRFFLHKTTYDKIPRTIPDIFSVYPLFQQGKIGTTIWQMITEKKDTPNIIEAISKNYNIPAPKVKTDLESLIKDLRQEELVKMHTEKPKA